MIHLSWSTSLQVMSFCHMNKPTGWMRSSHGKMELIFTLYSTATWRIKGPDAIKYLSSVLVIQLWKIPVGTAKHAIMCNEKGLNMGDGVMLRLDEDEFLFYEMGHYISPRFRTGQWYAVGEDLTGTKFMYQIAGPRSLRSSRRQPVKDSTISRFLHHRKSSISWGWSNTSYEWVWPVR